MQAAGSPRLVYFWSQDDFFVKPICLITRALLLPPAWLEPLCSRPWRVYPPVSSYTYLSICLAASVYLWSILLFVDLLVLFSFLALIVSSPGVQRWLEWMQINATETLKKGLAGSWTGKTDGVKFGGAALWGLLKPTREDCLGSSWIQKTDL